MNVRPLSDLALKAYVDRFQRELDSISENHPGPTAMIRARLLQAVYEWLKEQSWPGKPPMK